MKNAFNIIVITACLAVATIAYVFVLGSPNNFKDKDKHEPINTLGTIYTGGPLVASLMGFLLISVTYVAERYWSIKKANGKGSLPEFVKNVQTGLASGNIDTALEACENQRGSLANIIRSGLEKYKVVSDMNIDNEKKVLEIKRAIDEATNLETPLLEKNLVILSTISSISTMVGLLGTTLGMIRSFAALGAGGAVSATQLSVGISEALYNTAFGLATAIICIVAFNFFTTKVDNFTYMIDEAILSVTEILEIKLKK